MSTQLPVLTKSMFLLRPALVVLLLASLGQVRAVPIYNEDFNALNGGFTVNTPVAYDGPWVYDAASGRWTEAGQGPENQHANTSMLNSPTINISDAGAVTLSFAHRYSFESGGWDGGQVRLSVNGGPYATVPGAAFSANSYNGSVLPNSASVLFGQSAFVENSPNFAGGTITSVADLGSYNIGDTLSLQFIVGNDTNTRGQFQPNWQIDSVALSSSPLAVPETTSTLTLFVLGLCGLFVTRRFIVV